MAGVSIDDDESHGEQCITCGTGGQITEDDLLRNSCLPQSQQFDQSESNSQHLYRK